MDEFSRLCYPQKALQIPSFSGMDGEFQAISTEQLKLKGALLKSLIMYSLQQ